MFADPETFASELLLEEFLQPMLELGRALCESPLALAWWLDRKGEQLSLAALSREATVSERPDRDEWLREFSGTVLRSRKLVRQRLPPTQSLGVQEVLAVAVHLSDRPLGVLVFCDPQRSPENALMQLTHRLADEMRTRILLQQSNQRVERLHSLVDFLGKIGANLDRNQILRLIIQNASELLGAEAGSLFMMDAETKHLVMEVSSNLNDEQSTKVRVPLGKGIIGYVAQTGEPVIVNDARSDSRHFDGVDRAIQFTTRSLLAVPLRTRTINLGQRRGQMTEQVIGGLEAINKKGGSFDELDLSLLETFANQAATILQIATLYADSLQLFEDMIRVLMEMLDARDPYTQGHSVRVSDLSVMIGAQLGLDSETLYHLRLGSLMHDIGKIGVPDAVLRKQGPLTEEEFLMMKTHPQTGERILSQVHLLSDERYAVTQHHERFDGKGYPRGLAGDEISILGRIVAVADAFDAITSSRPYRKGMTIEQALERIGSGAGTQFDPRVVGALADLCRRGLVQTAG